MLKKQAQSVLLGDGLMAEDSPVSPLNDPLDQLEAATGPSLRGTAANDRLRGTNDDEVIQGLAGNDTLIGRRGADRLLGQAGDDSLVGGGGDDTLIGGAGNDRLKGGGGSDNLKGGSGDDTLLGGGGADTLKGGGGEDSLNGGGGSDLLAGGGKSDTLDGSRGDDTLKGGGGDDLILGGVGSDLIVGGGGADTIRYRNADFAKGEVDVITGFKTGEDKVDLSAVTIPAQGLGFVLVEGSIALEIAGGRLVFRGIADPAQLSAQDFLLADSAAPIRFTLPTTPPPGEENRAPTLSGPVETGASQADPAFTIDLLSGASDPDDGDVLSVSDLTLTSGDASGVNISGATLDVDPAAYQRLAAGETEVITYAYQVSDNDGATVAQTATVTVFGVNDAPVASDPVTAPTSEDDAGFVVDLLAGTSDPDAGANLSVEGATRISGNNRGVVLDGEALEVDPGAYNDLGAGDVETIVFRYNVTDGLGGIAAQTATITINGRNDAPTVTAEVRGGGVANGGTFSVNLLDGARDADAGDSLTITGLRVVSGDASGVQENGDRLIVDPSAYPSLSGGQDVEIVYAYAVTDAFGASVVQTATVTIIGVNDAPVTTGPIAVAVSEDDAGFVVDLLAGAVDPDGSAGLSVEGLTLVSGNDRGIVFSGTALEVSPGAYTDLRDDEAETIVFRYNVTDGSGGVAAQTATITIDGRNDAPTVAAEVRAGGIAEGAGFTVDLLDGARDADAGETLTISGLRIVSGDASGVSESGDILTVDPSVYSGLGEDQNEVIVYAYAVVDGSGASVAQTATITIAGANNAPVTSEQVTASASEDDAGFIVDLLAGTSDPDAGANLSVQGVTLVSGNSRGVIFSGAALEVDPGVYNDLGAGDVETIVFRYNVTDGLGGVAAQTATITINGRNDAPMVTTEVRGGGGANGGTFSVDLLDGARDADAGDSLTITGLRVVSGDASGVQQSGRNLIVDPSDFTALGQGQSEEIIFAYAIVDGAGASIDQTATITIAGANDAPSVTAQLSFETSEDDARFTLDLLQGAFDPDAGDVLSVASFAPVSGDPAGVVLAGSRLDINPDAYNRLGVDDVETVVFRYDVSDGKGGLAEQTVTIAIAGVNDAPVASFELTAGGSELGDDITLNLLDDAVDADQGDVLSVQGVVLSSGDGSGVTIGQNSLSVDVSAYESLSLGAVETIRYSYQVVDGNGGSVARTAVITVIGENSAPTVSGPVTVLLNEFGAPLDIDLLQGASDIDRSDMVSVANLRLTGGDAVGVTVAGGALSVDPFAYRTLLEDEREVITYAYDLTDGNGGVTSQTAEITIEGFDEFRTFFGSDEADQFEGTPDRDEIFGGAGDDTIVGGNRDDLIFGGANDDVIGTSLGQDRLTGGGGRDEFVITFADEENERFDFATDIITDFDPLLDTLNLRKVIPATDRLADFVGVFPEPELNQTTVVTFDGDLVILEGLDLSFQQMLDLGIFVFNTPNRHFEENPFGFQNQAFGDGPQTSIFLSELGPGEEYFIEDNDTSGAIFIDGNFVTFDPGGFFLGPGEFATVGAVVVHVDEFGTEARATVVWTVEPGNQPPEFFGELFTPFETEGSIAWDLNDFADDDGFTFDFSPPGPLEFFVTSPPEFGSVSLNGSDVVFTLGDEFFDLKEDETRAVDIEFEVVDAEGFNEFATFTVDVRGVSDLVVAGEGPLADSIQFVSDVDTFDVRLEAGVEYALQARGAGTGDGDLSDPFLRLFDSNFVFIDDDDNTGNGGNALIAFTPVETAFYILQVEASDGGTGDYVIEAKTDDFGDTLATAGQTAPGQSIVGDRETPGDLDYLTVFLEAETTYQFDLRGAPSGAGTLADPSLFLETTAGDFLDQNDIFFDPDIGETVLDARITFTPTVSDTYVLIVDSFFFEDNGTWELSTTELI